MSIFHFTTCPIKTQIKRLSDTDFCIPEYLAMEKEGNDSNYFSEFMVEHLFSILSGHWA